MMFFEISVQIKMGLRMCNYNRSYGLVHVVSPPYCLFFLSQSVVKICFQLMYSVFILNQALKGFAES